MSQYFLNKYN